MVVREFTGWLWGFLWFRWLVVSWCRAGWLGSDWLSRETPLLVSLRDLFLREGDLDLAADVARSLREGGDL